MRLTQSSSAFGHEQIRSVVERRALPVNHQVVVVRVHGILVKVPQDELCATTVGFVGEPFRLPSGRARGQELHEYTNLIMRRIAELLPEEYRGMYG